MNPGLRTATVDQVKRIQLLDLASERELLGEEMIAALGRVVESGAFVLGPEVERFEAAFAELCGGGHAVGVGSGTDAVILALKAVDLERGDHVLTTPFTFFASAGAIAWLGGVPRFADIDPATGLMDPSTVAAAIDGETRGLLPVHLYGQLTDMRALNGMARERGLFLVEDGCQAHGATRDGVHCGELGDVCSFSFYPTKNLGAAGEAGLITTRDEALADRLRSLRDHGMRAKYEHLELGTNSRLDAFQAAILNVKLPHLAGWTRRRVELAERYDAELGGIDGIDPLVRVDGAEHVYHQYAVRVTPEISRDGLLASLAEEGILAGVHYPRPVHLQEAARPWGYGPGDFPHAEALANEVLCLPVHPFLTDADQERVLETLARLVR